MISARYKIFARAGETVARIILDAVGRYRGSLMGALSSDFHASGPLQFE